MIETYCALLQHFETLDEQSLSHIVKMFGRISSTHECDKESLFYLASHFYLFNEILQHPISKTPGFADLRTFIELVTSSAIAKISERPSLIIELFFHKTKSDCYRIQNGDNDEGWRDYVPQEVPDQEIIAAEFQTAHPDSAIRGEQIRKLSTLMALTSDGNEFLRWLSRCLRKVLYQDFDDLEGDFDIVDGILLSAFGILY